MPKTMYIFVKYPETVPANEIKDYCQAALECWGGQFHPDDHLFGTVKAPKKAMFIVKPPKKKDY